MTNVHSERIRSVNAPTRERIVVVHLVGGDIILKTHYRY